MKEVLINRNLRVKQACFCSLFPASTSSSSISEEIQTLHCNQKDLKVGNGALISKLSLISYHVQKTHNMKMGKCRAQQLAIVSPNKESIKLRVKKLEPSCQNLEKVIHYYSGFSGNKSTLICYYFSEKRHPVNGTSVLIFNVTY